MPRSGEEARRRLQEAALELFRERGFDRTAASEIAARAGVTERTFFRHFSDKREALFDGQARLRTALTGAVADVPDGLPPLEMLHRALRSIEPMMEDSRAFVVARQQVIVSTPALQERERTKIAALTQNMATALQQRGVDERRAILAAELGMASFNYAVTSWFADPSRRFGVHLDHAFGEMGDLLTKAA